MKQSRLKRWIIFALIIVFWISSELLLYYIFPWFSIPFLWMIISILLLIITILYCICLFKSIRTNLFKEKLIKFSILFVLLFFFIFKFNYLPKTVIEKLDWIVLFNKRSEIIKQVQDRVLKPNVSWNEITCELPFKFPIVSNGGNSILIYFNDDEKCTVEFYVFANFFENPSTKFIYTESEEFILSLEEKIKMNPSNNWKLRENWYRIYGD